MTSIYEREEEGDVRHTEKTGEQDIKMEADIEKM